MSGKHNLILPSNIFSLVFYFLLCNSFRVVLLQLIFFGTSSLKYILRVPSIICFVTTPWVKIAFFFTTTKTTVYQYQTCNKYTDRIFWSFELDRDPFGMYVY